MTQLGDAPEFTVRLLGVGNVSGNVVLSDGVTPIGGAVVTLVSQTPRFYGQTQRVFTDFTGRFSFDNVPNGTYCLLAEFLVLGVNYTSAITNANQNDFVNLPLGASGTVIGKLVRADGITPVADVDVLLTFRSQSSIAGYALARTSPNGMFTMPLIPLGDFSLEAIAPLLNGIARIKSRVAVNLETVNLGNVVLDEADPFVVSTYPADGAGNVHVATQPQILFSEALDLASLDALSIYFCSGAGVMIPAIPTLTTTNGVSRLVRLVTTQLLESQSSYDVVVLHKPYRGGRVVTDLVGRPLASAQLFHFTTADNRRPEVVSIFPSNSAVQIDPRAVMRVSFNEPVQPAGFSFNLSGPNGPVAGTASVGFNGLVVAFAPASPLAANARYTLSLSGARDLVGNLMATPVSTSFDTLDTIGPEVATLRVADNRAPVANGTIQVEALLLANEPSVTVRFTRDFQPVGLAPVPPYRMNVTLPASGATTVRAYASDRYGNEGTNVDLVINVVSNQPPLVQLARVIPLTGPVGSSNTLVLQVSAADDYTVTNLTLVGLGAFAYVTNLTSGATQLVAVAVPPDQVAGAVLQIRAQAIDGLGVASDVAALDVDISDGTAPALAINSPMTNALLNPAQPLTLALTTSDNSTELSLDVFLSGALATTLTTNVLVVTNQPVNISFDFALGAALTNGVPLVATVVARDTTGNSNTVSRVFRLPDREPPRLVSVNPTNGAGAQSLWLDHVRFEFTEAIATNSVTTNLFVFTHGVPAPYTVVTGATPQMVLLQPTALPLPPGAGHTNLIRLGVTDLDGNALVDSNGAPLPAEGLSFTFTTANFLNVLPTNGTPIVPGQNIVATVEFEAGLGADGFSFAFGANPPVT
ncbi:MAG: Ig-like domain-containing protein, partial [Phycisphaeraceae bacterium]